MNAPRQLTPITDPIPAIRQGAKRHYGVHPYFTRRPYNVVRDYILHYSRPGDVILDPYGGSGVTAIEAFLANRTGIHNDINPLANFIAQGIAELSKGTLTTYSRAFYQLELDCKRELGVIETASEREVQQAMKRVPLPPDIRLPPTSDAVTLYGMFLPRQLVALGLIKQCVDRISDRPSRSAALLAFSATLAKLNKTFLSAEGRAESRGGSSIFSIYRYKIAKEPVILPFWNTFCDRLANVLDAKGEIDSIIETKRRTTGFTGKFTCMSHDAAEIIDSLKGKVDYIFTDPPYGAHIQYLDLSTMWNCWLGLPVTEKQKSAEIIVGGERKYSENHYIDRLRLSISASVQMLKPDRWMSVVFQHWNMKYFNAILEAAADSHASLSAAVCQIGDPIWSMHKKKSKESVLAGEMILTFHKGSMRSPGKKNREAFDLAAELSRLLDKAESRPVYGESLLNELIVRAWENGSLSDLEVTKESFTDLMEERGWRYDSAKHWWDSEKAQAGLF